METQAFYNTTNQTGRMLAESEKKAFTQQSEVHYIFMRSVTGLTASEVFKRYPKRNTPLTSIRRAITNLANDKFLVKTKQKRQGMYGKPEYVYELYTGQLNLFEL